MNLISKIVAAFLMLAIASPTPIAAQESAQSGMVVVGQTDRQNYLFVFRRVDLETRTFAGPPIRVGINNSSGIVAGNQMNYRNRERPVSLVWKDVEPGYYAWVEANVAINRGVAVSGVLYTGCLNEFAPVFQVRAGNASLIRVDDFTEVTSRASPDAVLAEFDRAVAERPRAFTERAIAPAVGYASWPRHGSGLALTRNCGEPAAFAFSDMPPGALGEP